MLYTNNSEKRDSMDNFISEVYYFIIPYLSDNGKFIECITEYNNYNMELVEKDRNKILAFVAKNFNIRKGSISIDELLCGKDNQLWNKLSTLSDLGAFEKLVGLLIAVGLLEDSFLTRAKSFGDIGKYGEFLIKEKFCFFDEETTENYLSIIKDYVLPNYRFNINEAMFDYMTRIFTTDQNEDIKEKLISWIKTSKIPVNDNDLRIIYGFLSYNFEQFFNAIVTGFDSHEGPEALVNYLRFDPEFDYLVRINNLINSYTEEQREDLENKKRLFLSYIDELIKKRKYR